MMAESKHAEMNSLNVMVTMLSTMIGKFCDANFDHRTSCGPTFGTNLHVCSGNKYTFF